jgi:hypothetical protein
MAINTQSFHETLIKVIKIANEINSNILTKKISNVIEIKKNYLYLKKIIENKIPDDMMIDYEGKSINCRNELLEETDKKYAISLKFFRSIHWGVFAQLNPKRFPELYEMMVNQNGELVSSFDDFKGTVAVMDFHGYTKFSNEIKYNKTPLQEFGDILPQKIELICTLCRTLVYESEGDALILIGPENPVYIFNAAVLIIELARQRVLNPKSNPKNFHNIEIKNPLIKPFEMNAAITTGGETFINSQGDIIGTIISEASRILKIINTKMPNKSGILLSEKVYRKFEKYKAVKTDTIVTIEDFKIGVPILVDVKGMRVNIREVYLDEKEYKITGEVNSKNLIEEIRKKNSSKWYNIFIYFIKLLLSTLHDIKCSVTISGEELNQDKIDMLLNEKLYEWVNDTSPDSIRTTLRITSILYKNVPEIRDAIAIYYEYIQENYYFIAEKLENFYAEQMKKEEQSLPSIKKLVENYSSEMRRIKKRILPKRILETTLSDTRLNELLMDVPYIGKD